MMQISSIKSVVHAVSLALVLGVFAIPGIAVAQEDKKEERKTTQTGSMSEKVYKKLAEAQALAAPEDPAAKPDFAGAVAKLKEIEAMPKLSEYEQAQLYNFYGFVYYSQEQYAQSISAYQKVLKLVEIPPGLRNQVIYTLAQLKFTTEKYQEAIDLINDWLKTQENPGPEPYVLIGTGYYQLEQMDKIIPPLEKALTIAAERGSKPKEQWYLLLRVAYWEKGDTKKVKELLEILVTNWPKKEYWAQLSAVYGEMDNEPKQLSAYASAYDQDLFTNNSEYMQIAQLYLANDVPYKAAKILERGLANDIVERTAKNLRLYSQAWALAREDDKAIPPLKEAAKLSKEGELDLRLAQSYLNLSQYKSCISSARTAIKKGGIKRTDVANMILGMCLFETDDLSNARAAFSKAARDERSEKSARQWLLYIKSEEDRIERLEASLASLKAG